MKRKVLALAIGMLLIGLNLYAADGDLIVQGNLGVGTTSPAVKVSAVAGASNSWVADFYGLATSNILRIGNFNGYPTIGANNNAGTQWTDLSINPVGNTLFATSSGNIGIGTASPISKVNVRTGTDENLVVRPYSDFGTGFEGMLIHSINDGNSAHKVVGIEGSKVLINAGTLGKVGIGTTDPGNYQLYLVGNARASGIWEDSDANFKENIASIVSPLGKVLSMQGVTFDWKRTIQMPKNEYNKEGGEITIQGTRYGVIAQQIEGIMPEAVSAGPEGEKAVAYTQIIPVLIEAIKEQQKQIEALKSDVAALKGQR